MLEFNILRFENLQKAWEGVNEFMVFNEDKISKAGGGVYGTEFISYNNLIIANTAQIDKNFDFGKVLGYHIKKWTTLLKNYVDFAYLDLIKSELNTRINKKARSYNYAFHFSNKYGGGKDCLLNLVFTKRISEEWPTVHFHVRTSEVTCRLIFDFLLVQRICEYVYGKDYPVEVHFHAPSMFVTAERFSIYSDYKGWDYIEPKLGEGKFNRRVRQVYNMFSTVDPETIKYKAHKRCAQTIQRDENGDSLKKAASMKAKNLPLTKLIKKLPIDVVTTKQMNKFLKQQKGK